MNKNNLVKIIGRELSILTDFVNGFTDNEKIHPMEVDLALSKAKDIYNELLLLKGEEPSADAENQVFKETRKNVVEPKKTIIEDSVEECKFEEETLKAEPTIFEEPIATEEVVLELINEIPPVVDEVKLIEEPKNVDSETLRVEPETDSSAELLQPITEAEKLPEVIVEPTPKPKLPDGILEIKPKKAVQKSSEKEVNIKGEIIADKFPKESFSINDRLAGFKSNNDLASLLKGTPITDLKKAIKLNDRVWFTNELFNKNGATFENAVDTVNKSADLDSALNYLVENFNWNQEAKSTINFLELVFRRFPSK